MICQKCLKRNAQFHSYKIINNQLIDIHLCVRCIRNKNAHETANGIDDKLHSLVEVLLNSNMKKNGSSPNLKCDFCGTTLIDFQKNELLGCPKCYEIFSAFIYKGKKRPHKDFQKYNILKKHSELIELLKKKLKKAVEFEDFEKAADLRDKIQNLEKKGFISDNRRSCKK